MSSRVLPTTGTLVDEALTATSIIDIEEAVVAALGNNRMNPIVVFYRYDIESSSLKPTVASPGTAGCVSQLPVLSQDSHAWLAYQHQECRRVDPYTDFTDVSITPGESATAIVAPISRFGVLVVCSWGDPVTEADCQSIETMARTAHLSIERLLFQNQIQTFVQDLQPKFEQDADQRSLIFSVVESVFREDTIPDLSQALCEMVLQRDDVPLVAIVPREAFATDRKAYYWAGEHAGYLDAVYHPTEHSAEPTFEAARTRDRIVHTDVGVKSETESWAALALDCGITGVISAPLIYKDAFFGVVSIYFDELEPLDERDEELITIGSKVIAGAFSSIDVRHAFIAGHGVEFELATQEETCFNRHLAELSDTHLAFESVIPVSDEQSLAYVRVTDGNMGEVLDLPDNSLQVTEASFLTETGSGPLIELTLKAELVEQQLARLGVRPVRVTSDKYEVRIRATHAPHRSVRTILDSMGESYPSFELLSQRKTNPGSAVSDAGSVLSQLSDRQREIITLALHEGYFETPRSASGEDLAEQLEMAPSTFYEHVRAAQRNLLRSLFSDQPDMAD